jgi:hypothetical protein
MGSEVQITETDPTFLGALHAANLRARLEAMSWPDRVAFMSAVDDILRRHFCRHCWYADPECQCWNDD